LRRVFWPNGAMTAPALPLRPASKRWEAPPQCPLRAASRPRCISDTPVSNPYALRSSNLLGLGTFQEPWAEAYYQRKRQEGKTHSMAGRAAPPCVGSDQLRPLAQARALPGGYLPRCPAGSWLSCRLKQPRDAKREDIGALKLAISALDIECLASSCTGCVGYRGRRRDKPAGPDQNVCKMVIPDTSQAW
jgi:hypothetical protein